MSGDFSPAPERGSRLVDVEDTEAKKTGWRFGLKIQTRPGWLRRLWAKLRGKQ